MVPFSNVFFVAVLGHEPVFSSEPLYTFAWARFVTAGACVFVESLSASKQDHYLQALADSMKAWSDKYVCLEGCSGCRLWLGCRDYEHISVAEFHGEDKVIEQGACTGGEWPGRWCGDSDRHVTGAVHGDGVPRLPGSGAAARPKADKKQETGISHSFAAGS